MGSLSSQDMSVNTALSQSDGPTEVRGALDLMISLLQKTIGQEFAAIVGRFPNRAAIKSTNHEVSYVELNEMSDILAIALLNLEVRPGDRVAVSLGNCIEYAVIVYACFKIGAILVPLNPAYTPLQTISALNHISAQCLIISAEITLPYKDPQSTKELLNKIVCPDPNVSAKVSSLRDIILIDNSCGRVDITSMPVTADYYALLLAYRGQRFLIQHQLHADDVINIQFTSGTTSAPKAACLTHRNILNNGFLVGEGMELSENDIICCPPPLYHCFGLVLGLLAAMTHGATLLLPSESFNARATLKSIADHHATVLYGVPTMFIAELDLLSENLLPPSAIRQLRTGVIGGSSIPPALRIELHDKMNLSGLTNCYGLTEASPIACMTRIDDPLESKLETVGKVLPHTSIRITARDDPNQILPRGEKGEIQIGGYSVMKGYWRAETETEKVLVEDNHFSTKNKNRASSSSAYYPRFWLRSGDEGLIDQDGNIIITGRIKDIIIRGGENIYPAEIENCLLQHDLIGNASVVGLPDARYGEVVAAFIVPQEGVTPIVEDQDQTGDLRLAKDAIDEHHTNNNLVLISAEVVRLWIRQHLSKMLAPKYVFWVSQLPLTASGKVEKYKLREMGEDWMRQ